MASVDTTIVDQSIPDVQLPSYIPFQYKMFAISQKEDFLANEILEILNDMYPPESTDVDASDIKDFFTKINENDNIPIRILVLSNNINAEVHKQIKKHLGEIEIAVTDTNGQATSKTIKDLDISVINDLITNNTKIYNEIKGSGSTDITNNQYLQGLKKLYGVK